MELNVGKEVAALQRMTVGELRAKYAEVFSEETNARHKQWLLRRIIWRMQAQAAGDLSERARQRAIELANDADLRTCAPKTTRYTPATTLAAEQHTKVATISMAGDNRLPMPGAIITRKYKNQTLDVRVLPKGFEFEGEVYKSLSAVAKKITGAHCNGFYFFRLGGLGSAK